MSRSFTIPEWLRVTRPIQCLTVLMGTWASAVLFGQQAPFSTSAINVSIVMGLLALAASLFHAGYTSPTAPHAQRFVDAPSTGNRRVILFWAVAFCAGSFFTAARYLSIFQVLLVLVTALMLFEYCRTAGSNNYWAIRNGAFGLIATMPMSIGAMNAVGDPNAINPAYLPLFLAVFALYFTRETVKTTYEAAAGGAHHELPVEMVDRTVYFGLKGTALLTVVCCGLIGAILLIMYTSIRATGANISLLSILPILCPFGIVPGVLMTDIKVFPHLQRVVTACVWLIAASLIVGKV